MPSHTPHCWFIRLIVPAYAAFLVVASGIWAASYIMVAWSKFHPDATPRALTIETIVVFSMSFIFSGFLGLSVFIFIARRIGLIADGHTIVNSEITNSNVLNGGDSSNKVNIRTDA